MESKNVAFQGLSPIFRTILPELLKKRVCIKLQLNKSP